MKRVIVSAFCVAVLVVPALGAQQTQKQLATVGQERMINPQPEPPGITSTITNPAQKKMINPQPEPPGVTPKVTNPVQKKMINPQPEPPAPAGTAVPAQ